MTFKVLALLLICFMFIVNCSSQYEPLTSKVNNLSFIPSTPPPLCSAVKNIGTRAIYGEDDRRDWYEASSIYVAWAQATMALMYSSNLIDQGVRYKIVGQTYKDVSNLCEGVSFAKQPSAAFCSGFLVSPDLVVTAGHCIRDLDDCKKTHFVFNFSKSSEDQKKYYINKANVYSCSDIVAQSINGGDYAVIRLNQEVVGRTPFNLRRTGVLDIGNELALIGHPSGLPSKIATGGTVRGVGEMIVASVDAFAGNSGSAAVNMATGLVEGILVAGEPDFIEQGSCQVENRCGSECKGEQLTPISKVLPYIPDINYDAPSCTGDEIN